MIERVIERRFVPAEEIRAEDTGEQFVLRGYAVRWDSPTELWEGEWEQFRRGAFARTIANGTDVRALFNHDPNLVLGRRKNGTLHLVEDDEGLSYAAVLNREDPDAVATFQKVRRGDVDQSSFAFIVERDGEEFSKRADGSLLRTVTGARLVDVSPVTYPAYEDTEVLARAEMAFRNREDSGGKGVREGGEPAEEGGPGPASHLPELDRRRRELQLREREQWIFRSCMTSGRV